ncbi:MAG: methylated-DNA--[protein]-cysteine S-methyltransferase [Firmicutes bacterium]|nr:methylated-DNA--[protein]-cysteine S-methyltransferase [Bacillota bacterium]
MTAHLGTPGELWTGLYRFESWEFELLWGEEGLCYLGTLAGTWEMTRYLQRYWPGAALRRASTLPDPLARQLSEYFAGTRYHWDFPILPRGTPFQKAVWEAVLKIPYGEVRTYAEIAHALGRERGFRAIGAAVGSNPISLLIPCHRVVASGGGLGGYGGGVDLKARLLAHEAAHRPAGGKE